MRERDLDSAISEIIHACSDSTGANPPFFFIVGAGLSHPIIETASGLMGECKAKALKNGKSAEPPSQDRMDTYSYWMDAAFPHAEQRRKYLQEKVQNKNISLATYCANGCHSKFRRFLNSGSKTIRRTTCHMRPSAYCPSISHAVRNPTNPPRPRHVLVL